MSGPGSARLVTHNYEGASCPVVVAVPGQPTHVFGHAEAITDPSEAITFMRQEGVDTADAERTHTYVLTVRYGGTRDEVDDAVADATTRLYESLDTDGRHDLTATATATDGEVLGHLIYEANSAGDHVGLPPE